MACPLRQAVTALSATATERRAVLRWVAGLAILVCLGREAAAQHIVDDPPTEASELDPCEKAVERLAKARPAFVRQEGGDVLVRYPLKQPWLSVDGFGRRVGFSDPKGRVFRVYRVPTSAGAAQFYVTWLRGKNCAARAIPTCLAAHGTTPFAGATAKSLGSTFYVQRETNPALLGVRIWERQDEGLVSELVQLLQVGASAQVLTGCCVGATGTKSTAKFLERTAAGSQMWAEATWREPSKRGRRVTEWLLENKRLPCKVVRQKQSVRLDAEDVVSIEVTEVLPKAGELLGMLTKALTTSFLTNGFYRCAQNAARDGEVRSPIADASLSLCATIVADSGKLVVAADGAIPAQLAECLQTKLSIVAERVQKSVAFSSFRLRIRYRWSAGD